ncbi:MAG TPA: peptidoglycan DD-metalloendopeptidase family protein [bacterium]|nr:peptidoglycan DD-metalloendopeptidase family protein [bacterium]
MAWWIIGAWVFLYPAAAVMAFEVESNLENLREQWRVEQKRAQALQVRQVEMENALRHNQANLKQNEKIFQNYRYNLDQAQKVIDATRREIQQIEKRIQDREDAIAQYLRALTSTRMENAFHHPEDRLRYQITVRAAGAITARLFSEMQAALPRLRELIELIRDKNDLRDRILTRYLPADLEKDQGKESENQDTEARAGEEATGVAEPTRVPEEEFHKQIEQLRAQLASAEKEIRFRITERHRLTALSQSIIDPQTAGALSPASLLGEGQTNPALPSAPSTENSKEDLPFESWKGKLYWPAPGKIIRPFGEFTHPEYRVKMNNSGIDVQTFPGPPSTIRAIAPGKVIYSGAIGGYGSAILISHAGDYLSVYGNVMSQVAKDETVQASQVIGKTIGTWYHFEIRLGENALNPLEWLGPLEEN